MADKFIYIPNVNNQNYPFCKLQLEVETIELDKPTYQNTFKVPKVRSQRIIKRYCKT